MRIGFSLPQIGPLARQAADIAQFAHDAEALGAGSFWAGDRLLAPVEPTVGYPPGADTIPDQFREILDPFALLTVAATATEHALLGTNVLNAPWYPPALLARSLTTIDLVSRGRLVPGFGSGWAPEEFAAVNVPFAERGPRLEETLDALDVLWTEEVAAYAGKRWTVPATHAHLKPVQRPRPPIYLAGFSATAMRRVARRADGWLPILAFPGEVDPAATVAAPMNEIRRQAEEAGRDPASLDLILRVYPHTGATIDDVVTAIRRAEEEAGVRHVLVDLLFLATNVEHYLELAAEVLRRAGD